MARTKFIFPFLLLVSFSVVSVFAQTGTVSNSPKIGLVLSGGGAKGFAHLGVIKVLQEEGIPFDIIGGTSMGAIVGGLIASGIPVDSIISLIRKMDWSYLLSDDIPRPDLSVTEKKDKDRFLISVPITKQGLSLPAGIIRGQHIENMLHMLTAHVYDIRDFDKLPIPFLCIALDVDKNRKVVLKSGDLADAMRASMSIPTVFEPMIIGGDRMVDGGLVDNFPVQEVMQEGANVIIGVDVGHQPKLAGQKENMLSVMEDAVFYYSSFVKEKSLKHVNLYIHPFLHGLNVSSFTEFDSLFAYGEQAAREKLPEIRRLADSLHRLGRQYRPVNQNIKHDSLHVISIQMAGLDHLSQRLLNASIPFHALEWVKPFEINRAAEKFYASNYFEKVTFSIEPGLNGARVIFHFREKRGGRFNTGLYYDSDYKTILSLSTTFLNLIIKGSRLSMTGRLGRNPGLDISYFVDRGPVPAPGLEISGNFLETYKYDENRSRMASYNYFNSNISLFMQSKFNNQVLLRLGGEMEHTGIKSKISDIDFGTVQDNFYGIFLDAFMDTRNRPAFPTHGFKMRGMARYFSNRYYHPISYLNLDVQKPKSFTDRFSMVNEIFGGVTGTTVKGDSIPFQYYYWLGGQTEYTRFGNIAFPGYKFLESGSTSLFFYKVDLQYELFDNFFIGLTGALGTRAQNIPDIGDAQYTITGFGATAGYLTPIGPIKVSLSKSGEYGGVVGYFQIGFSF